jgi:hypothetical protein
MSVYVDRSQYGYGRMIMCHMMADTLDELHTMANKLGVRKWFQGKSKYPHYDLCKSRRALAVKHGAIELNTNREVATILDKVRKQALSHA